MNWTCSSHSLLSSCPVFQKRKPEAATRQQTALLVAIRCLGLAERLEPRRAWIQVLYLVASSIEGSFFTARPRTGSLELTPSGRLLSAPLHREDFSCRSECHLRNHKPSRPHHSCGLISDVAHTLILPLCHLGTFQLLEYTFFLLSSALRGAA